MSKPEKSKNPRGGFTRVRGGFTPVAIFMNFRGNIMLCYGLLECQGKSSSKKELVRERVS